MKIIEEKTTDVCINEMRDGDIGIITKWAGESSSRTVGKIVQRYINTLVVLGESSGSAYTSPFASDNIRDLRVRILGKGTLLEI